jgi:hypothetical protein
MDKKLNKIFLKIFNHKMINFLKIFKNLLVKSLIKLSIDQQRQLLLMKNQLTIYKNINLVIIFIVPIRSDGMINATSLCKAAGKRLKKIYKLKII